MPTELAPRPPVAAGEDPWFPWSKDDPDAELRPEPDDTVDTVLACYAAECDASRPITTAAPSLDERAGHHAPGTRTSYIS